MPSPPAYHQAIVTLLQGIDIDNVREDLGRSLCARAGAYSFVSYDEWKEHVTMDLPSV